MRYLTPLLACLLLLAACGDGTTDEGDQQDTTMAEDSGESAGILSVGDQSWELSPRQCSVRSDQVTIWGTAISDSDVEIVFDVFSEGDYNLSVTGPDFEWLAGSGTGVVEDVAIEGDTVSGTATVTQGFSGDSAQATFEFNC